MSVRRKIRALGGFNQPGMRNSIVLIRRIGISAIGKGKSRDFKGFSLRRRGDELRSSKAFGGREIDGGGDFGRWR